MLSLSSIHTDDCTYYYRQLIAVISDLSPENINALTAYLEQSYQVNDMKILELIDIENHLEYDGAHFEDHKGGSTHLIIDRIEKVGV